jgi:uncharacterized repeat protein (TIGR03943 family)
MNWTRIARGLALAAWGGFFVYLWVSGRATTYIGPKTAWVVTLGALTLPVVALAYLWGARRQRTPASVKELGANALLVAPILLALMVPAPSLGALAVRNKQTRHGPPPVASAPEDGQIRLYEIAWASDSSKYASTAGVTSGMPVDFVGFVSQPAKGGKLVLSRFFVSCCAADATAYSVTVTGASSFPVDTWVSVKGTLAGRPGYGLTVAAESARKVAAPANPYN